MQAYSRAPVAALMQENWLAFLDQQSASTAFQGHSGQLLLALAYRSGQPGMPGDRERRDLFADCRTWIRQHRAVIC